MRFCLPFPLLILLPFVQLFSQETPAHFQPIAFYEEIKDRLTPLEEVKEGIEFFKDAAKPGIVLLNERIEYVAADKERYRVDHSIYYVLAQSGVDPIGKDTFRFRKKQESIHLVLAHAIKADGSITPVAKNAVFVQSPQDEADSNLYTDYEELVVIYPDIEIGSITEHIVITKEFEPIVENHLANSFYFQFNWPIYLTRYEIDVPNSFADRFHTSKIGTGIPIPTVLKTEERTRLQYEDYKRDGRSWETRREPSSDIGPVERITTFNSWDDVGDWIRGLVNERNTLSPELKAEIDSWTEGLSDRNDIIQAILEPIANEVRYTGLEFGLAGYQPYDCNLVWDQKYGDCKDKANLLSAALRYKGIDSNVVLIDTDGLGKFDKSFPSPFHFNHAIAVVHNDDGSKLFLDATVENLKVGDLPGNDNNRDVLIILDDKTEIARTPLVSTGQVHFDFDLELSSELTLSGWLHMYVDGYYGSWYETTFKEKTEDGLRWNMHERIDGLFPGAEMADVTFNEDFDSDTPIASSYFTFKNEASNDASNYTLALPNLTWFLPSPGETSEGRSTDFSIDKSESNVSVSIKLPGSVRPNTLPKDLNIATPDYQYSGQWWEEENRIKATVSVLHKTDRITPKNFSQFHKAVGSVNRWWKTPATFSTIEALQAAENEVEEPFPKLSSAIAQLALIEDLYSSDQPKKRRKALEQVIEWFPNERAEMYEAHMELVRLDIGEVEPKKLAKRIESLVTEYKQDITHEYYCWGEYLLAQELEKFDKNKDALKIFTRHAKDDTLSAYRRGWSAYNAGWILKQSNSKELVSIAKLGMQEESGALNDLVHLLVAFHLRNGDAKTLQKDLADLEETHPQKFKEVIEYVSNEIEENRDIKDARALKSWQKTIQPICDAHPELSECLTTLARIESSLLLETKLITSAKRMEQLVKQLKMPWYSEHAPSKATNKSKLDEMIRATEEAKEWDKQAALCLAYYFRHPSDVNLASKYLYWAVWSLNNHLDEPKLEAALFDLLLELPPANNHLVNANINFAKTLRADKQYEKAVQILEHLVSFPALEEGSKSIAHIRYAEALEEMDRTSDAIEQYLIGGEMHFTNYRVYTGLLRCFFLAQHNGDTKSALKALQFLSEGDSEKIKEAGVFDQTRNILAMNQDTEFRDEYWTKARALIAAAHDAMDKLEIDANDLPNTLPLISDYDEFSDSITQANTDGDLTNYHANIITAVLSAASNQTDLKLALSLISQNLQDDVVTLALFSTLAELAEFAAYEGSYLQSDELKRLAVHAYLENENQSKLKEWTNKIINDGKSSGQTMDFAILMHAGHVATKGILEDESFDQLEERLKVSEFATLRAKAVNLVAALQVESGKNREAKEFITRELQNPIITEDEEVSKDLNEYLEVINKQDSTSKELTELVFAFRDSGKMVWWDHIEPLNTDDLYSDGILRHKIENHFNDYTYVEMVKHFLLLAASDREDSQTRQEALIEGLRYWQYLNTNPEFVQEQVNTLASNPILDSSTRNEIKISHFYYILNVRHTELMEKLLSDDSFLSDAYQKDCRQLLEFMKMPKGTHEQSLAAIRFLMQGPFSATDKNQLRGAITNVVSRFGAEAAAPVIKEIPNIEPFSGASFDTTRLKLDALQAKRVAQKLTPFYELISDAAKLQSTTPAPYLINSNALSIDKLPSLMAYQLEQFGYTTNHFDDMGQILFYINSLSDHRDQALLEKINSEISELDPSFIATAIAYSIGAGIDMDDASQRDDFLNTLRTFATEKSDSSIADMHNQQLLYFNASSGGESPGTSFLSTNGASPKYKTTYDIIDSARNGNRSKALSLLQTLDTEILVDPELNSHFYALAKELGDQDLAELLSEEVNEGIKRQINWAISNKKWMPINFLSTFVSFPEKASDLIWYFDYIASQTENELILAHNDAAKAFAASDWQAVLDAVERADSIVPTFWDLDLAEGIAHFELGNLSESESALKSYLHYRPNSVVRGTVKTYLERIETKVASSEIKNTEQAIR